METNEFILYMILLGLLFCVAMIVLFSTLYWILSVIMRWTGGYGLPSDTSSYSGDSSYYDSSASSFDGGDSGGGGSGSDW